MTTVRELDAIQRAGRLLDDAVTELSNDALRALVDRYDGCAERDRERAEIFVRRHLVGLHRFPTGRKHD